MISGQDDATYERWCVLKRRGTHGQEARCQNEFKVIKWPNFIIISLSQEQEKRREKNKEEEKWKIQGRRKKIRKKYKRKARKIDAKIR